MAASPAASACCTNSADELRRAAARWSSICCAHVQAQVGGDLLVAAAAGVQLVADFAGKLHQPLFDVMVNVFDGRVVSRGHAFGGDLLERRAAWPASSAAVSTPALASADSVRLARRNLVRQQDAIERKRPLPLLEFRVQLLAEAARPHLHFATSELPLFIRRFRRQLRHLDFTSARERAGRPRMRMNPSASFWL